MHDLNVQNTLRFSYRSTWIHHAVDQESFFFPFLCPRRGHDLTFMKYPSLVSFSLCLASLCLLPSTLWLDPADTTQTSGLSFSPRPSPRSPPPLHFYLRGFGSCRELKRGEECRAYTAACQSHQFLEKRGGEGDVGRRKEGKEVFVFTAAL